MKKKVNRLSKKRKVIKRKESSKMVKAIENVEKRTGPERKRLEGIN